MDNLSFDEMVRQMEGYRSYSSDPPPPFFEPQYEQHDAYYTEDGGQPWVAGRSDAVFPSQQQQQETRQLPYASTSRFAHFPPQHHHPQPARVQPGPSAGFKNPLASAPARTMPSLTDAPPIRPVPIRPIYSQQQYQAPPPRRLAPFASASSRNHAANSGFPIPANGNTTRRRDYESRPDPRPALGMGASHSFAPTATHEKGVTAGVGRHAPLPARRPPPAAQDEDDYFGDDDPAFVKELVKMGTSPFQSDYDASRYELSPPSHAVRAAPPQQPATVINGVRLRPISDLPDMYRGIWKHKVFNAVQSQCFDAVLFELAIIRLLSTSSPDQDAKVVYLAPTKSLCSERARDWTKKFEGLRLGWGVIELTGDSSSGQSSLSSIGANKIIVTTPEKWDALTRRWSSYEKLLAKLKLFCIDECHFVGMDTRGAVLEVVVSRMKTLGTQTRFLACSATAPNIEDIGDWLGEAGAPAKVYKFGDEFRPCPLTKIVKGYASNGNDFAFNSTLNGHLYNLIQAHSSGKPVLVFVNTRKGCSQAAEAIAKEYKAQIDKQRGALPWPKPARQQGGRRAVDKQLAAFMEVGIAVHHAGLDNMDRRLVEDAFLDGRISVVCATSTLAVGVNLPARMVIIKGTKNYVDGKFVELSDLELLQMMGRAGRPQFDRIGVAVIMTNREMLDHYERLAKSQTILESGLHKSLTEHIVSEIDLGTITSLETALSWLSSTFLFVRISKNPSHYALDDGNTPPHERLTEIVTQAVDALLESGAIEQTGSVISSTALGSVMSKFYISHGTLIKLNGIPDGANMRTLLETMASCAEFSNIRFRAGEKGLFAKHNSLTKYPCQKVVTSADKVNIIIQLMLGGISLQDMKTDTSNPATEALVIWANAPRIAKCMVDLALERRDGGVQTAMELVRSLNTKAASYSRSRARLCMLTSQLQWEGSVFVLRQLEGIGEKSIKALSAAGIASFDDVASAETSRLETILSRNPPFGKKLVAAAKAIPRFEVDITPESETVLQGRGVHVKLKVDIGIVQTHPPPVSKKGSSRYHCSVLVTTSDGHYLEFRRIRVDLLIKSSKSFTIPVTLIKPSQRIVVMASCDDMAGTMTRASYKPTTQANEYPLPALGSSDDRMDMSDNDKDNLANVKKVAVDSAAAPKKPAGRQKSTDSTASSLPQVKRPDGKFDCAHRCGDKSKCRHLCCRDGLDKPPKAAAKSTKVATTDTHASAAQEKLPASFKAAKASSSKAPTDPTGPAKRPRAVPLHRKANAPIKVRSEVITLDSSEDDADSDSIDDLLTRPKFRPANLPTHALTSRENSKLTRSHSGPEKEGEDEEEDELDDTIAQPSSPKISAPSSDFWGKRSSSPIRVAELVSKRAKLSQQPFHSLDRHSLDFASNAKPDAAEDEVDELESETGDEVLDVPPIIGLPSSDDAAPDANKDAAPDVKIDAGFGTEHQPMSIDEEEAELLAWIEDNVIVTE